MRRRMLNAAMISMLTVSVLSASVLAGCSGGGETAETQIVNETQIATKVIEKTYPEATEAVEATTAAEKKESKSEKTESSDAEGGSGGSENSENSKNSENSQSNKSDSQSSKTSDTSKSGGSSAASKGKSTGSGGTLVKKGTPNLDSDSKTNDVASNSGYKTGDKTLTIEGNKYSVGDKVTVTYYVSYPEKLLNFQGFIDYDPKCLKAVEFDMLGAASSGSMVNMQSQNGRLFFNGSKLAGYKYQSGGEFMTVTYEVVGGGEASPKVYWEVISDMNSNSLIGNSDFSLSYTYS